MNRLVQESNERVMSLENKLREKEAVEELERRRRSLLSKGKVKSEEEISEVEKLMLEKGITDHETGADYFKWMNQAAKPTPARAFNSNVMDESARETLSKFWKNPAGAARDEASKALMELRRNPRPIGI